MWSPVHKGQIAFPVVEVRRVLVSSVFIFLLSVFLSTTMSDEANEHIDGGEEVCLDDSTRITALESNVEKIMGALEELVSRKRPAQDNDDAASAKLRRRVVI